jgi:putative transposase
MSTYRRYYLPGGTCFLTVVSHERRPFLTAELSRHCLRHAILTVQRARPFLTFAMVLLPDHWHTVWILPEGDHDYSLRMRSVKSIFTESYLAAGGKEGFLSKSRLRQGERGVWHRRFYEHTVRNELDMKQCVDYIHWNPVKHGLTTRVIDYPYSSFHRFMKMGEYPADWGGENPLPDREMPE